MKRKTNLFYLSGDDNNFISFSNYSESLTGNILSTDWKLFPSKFLCLYIKLLDVDDHDLYIERKEWFIKYLVSYYENKLAFLRDYYINNDLNVEKNLLPLNYLLEALYRLPENYGDDIKDYSDIGTNDDNVKISFVGDITEQDYNGIYTDIINVITSSDYAKGDIIVDHTLDIYNIEYPDSTDYLYGWVDANGDYNGPSGYDINPIYDYIDNGKNNYYVNSCITGISTEKHDNTEENIKFNILIPLYDLININKDSNTVKLVEDEKILINDVEQNGIVLTDSDTGYVKNVPMGIWFSETPVELKRDTKTGYSPSWSLVLSSQFKPFPYSQKIPGEISQNNIKDGYATYAQILIRQNKLLDKLESVISQINDLHKRVDKIESKLNVGSSYSVDKMQTELINFENHITKNLNDFKDEVYSKLSNNWKGYIS